MPPAPGDAAERSTALADTASNRLRFDAGERRNARPVNTGGEYRARTGDLLVANQALSQLS